MLAQRRLLKRKYDKDTLAAYVNKKDIKSKSMKVIHKNLSDTDFGVEQLASLLAMSRSTLQRQLKESHNINPSRLILDTRLDAATQCLLSNDQLGSIAYSVGFNSQSYFSKSFAVKYGVTPSQWRKQNK